MEAGPLGGSSAAHFAGNGWSQNNALLRKKGLREEVELQLGRRAQEQARLRAWEEQARQRAGAAPAAPIAPRQRGGAVRVESDRESQKEAFNALLVDPAGRALAAARELAMDPIELVFMSGMAAVYGVDFDVFCTYHLEQRAAQKRPLAEAITNFSAARLDYASCVEDVGKLLQRFSKFRELFPSERRALEQLDDSSQRVQHKLSVLQDWYQLHLGFESFDEEYEKVIGQPSRLRRKFLNMWATGARGLPALVSAADRNFKNRAVKLPSRPQLEPVTKLLHLVNELAEEAGSMGCKSHPTNKASTGDSSASEPAQHDPRLMLQQYGPDQLVHRLLQIDNIDCCDEQGVSILHHAVNEGKRAHVEALLCGGKTSSGEHRRADITLRAKMRDFENRKTALERACGQDDISSVPCWVCNQVGDIASCKCQLNWGVRHRQAEILLRLNATLQSTSSNFADCEPAAENVEAAKMVELLLSQAAFVSNVRRQLKIVLDCAAKIKVAAAKKYVQLQHPSASTCTAPAAFYAALQQKIAETPVTQKTDSERMIKESEERLNTFRKELSCGLSNYFMLLRAVGGPARPEIYLPGWLNNLKNPSKSVATRRVTLEEERQYAHAIRRDLVDKLTDSSTIVSYGMIALSRQMLRDAQESMQSHFLDTKEAVQDLDDNGDDDVRAQCAALVRGTVAFCRHVCETLQLAATYEVSDETICDDNGGLAERLHVSKHHVFRIQQIDRPKHNGHQWPPGRISADSDTIGELKEYERELPTAKLKISHGTAPAAFFDKVQDNLHSMKPPGLSAPLQPFMPAVSTPTGLPRCQASTDSATSQTSQASRDSTRSDISDSEDADRFRESLSRGTQSPNVAGITARGSTTPNVGLAMQLAFSQSPPAPAPTVDTFNGTSSGGGIGSNVRLAAPITSALPSITPLSKKELKQLEKAAKQEQKRKDKAAKQEEKAAKQRGKMAKVSEGIPNIGLGRLSDTTGDSAMATKNGFRASWQQQLEAETMRMSVGRTPLPKRGLTTPRRSASSSRLEQQMLEAEKAASGKHLQIGVGISQLPPSLDSAPKGRALVQNDQGGTPSLEMSLPPLGQVEAKPSVEIGDSPRVSPSPSPSSHPRSSRRRTTRAGSWDENMDGKTPTELLAIVPATVEGSEKAIKAMLAGASWSRDAEEAYTDGYILLLNVNAESTSIVQQKLTTAHDVVCVNTDAMGAFETPKGTIKLVSFSSITLQYHRNDFESLLEGLDYTLCNGCDVLHQRIKDFVDTVHSTTMTLTRLLHQEVAGLHEKFSRSRNTADINMSHVNQAASLSLEIVTEATQMEIGYMEFRELVERSTKMDRWLHEMLICYDHEHQMAQRDQQADVSPLTTPMSADSHTDHWNSAPLPELRPVLAIDSASRDPLLGLDLPQSRNESSPASLLRVDSPWADSGSPNPMTVRRAEAKWKMLQKEFSARPTGQLEGSRKTDLWEVDPLLKRDEQLMRDNMIGRVVLENRSHRATSPDSENQDESGELVFRQEESFLESKRLKHGCVTILTTTQSWLKETLSDCREVRELLQSERGDCRGIEVQEFDMGLKSLGALRAEFLGYFTNGLQLPQVFFGKTLIGGVDKIKALHREERIVDCLRLFVQSARRQEWEEIKLEDLTLAERLGSGASGEVRAALWNRNEVAVKIFDCAIGATRSDIDVHSDFRTELEIMHQLRHPNILNFYGAVTKDTSNYHLVLEKCACSVYAQLQKYGSLSAKDGGAKLNLATRVRYALDAAHGMVFLHERLIIHRDLKSSNLLIANDKDKKVKICDFSLSHDRHEKAMAAAGLTGVGDGTPGWISPEEVMGEPITDKADAYSFAMILWELLHSETPHYEDLFAEHVSPSLQKLRLMEISMQNKRPQVDGAKEQWFGVQGLSVQKSVTAGEDAEESVSPWEMYCDLMRRCWQREPATRPTFKQIQDELEVTLSVVREALRAAGVPPAPKA